MPNVLSPAAPTDNHLTAKLLQRQANGDRPVAELLSFLCTDSFYTMKEEFDNGISETRWINGGFVWDEDDLQGLIYGEPVEIDEDRPHPGLSLRSKQVGWRPDKRCVVMVRLHPLGSFTKKLEFGFVNRAKSGQVITSKGTPSDTGPGEYALGVRDPADSVYYDLLSRNSDDTSSSTATQERSVPVVNPNPGLGSFSEDSHTIMVALNERDEARLWINGSFVGTHRSAPSFRSRLGIWLHCEQTTLAVEYIQAWQERKPII